MQVPEIKKPESHAVRHGKHTRGPAVVQGATSKVPSAHPKNRLSNTVKKVDVPRPTKESTANTSSGILATASNCGKLTAPIPTAEMEISFVFKALI